MKPGTAKTICAKIALPIPIPRTVALVMDVKDGRSEVTSGILQIDNSTTEINIELVNKAQKAVNIREGEEIATLNQVTLADMDDIDEQLYSGSSIWSSLKLKHLLMNCRR